MDYSFYLAKSIIEKEFYTKTEDGLRIFGIWSQSCPESSLLDFATLQADITSLSIDYGLCNISNGTKEESI